MSNYCAGLHEGEEEKLGFAQRVIKPFEKARRQIEIKISGRAVKEDNVTKAFFVSTV